MELVQGYCIYQPAGYRRFVIVMIEVVQGFRVQRSDAAHDISERITLDSINLAVRMLPKIPYRIVHGICPPNSYKFSILNYTQQNEKCQTMRRLFQEVRQIVVGRLVLPLGLAALGLFFGSLFLQRQV